MKKIEAQTLAKEKSKLIIEYIIQMLSDTEIINGSFNFSSAKIDNQKMCTLDIYVPQKDFEKHLNLGITLDHDLVLYEQLLNDLLDIFLEHETMGVTRWYSIRSSQNSFTGINAVNTIGSKIKIDLNSSGPDFNNLITNYNKRINDYVVSVNQLSEQIDSVKKI